MNTKRITTELAEAAEILRRGGLVAVPTETVYGLAGNGMNAEAVEQIYEVKGRPETKPLSLMVHDASAMARYCEEVPAAAEYLAQCFWPGPLTIVLKAKQEIPSIVLAGGSTVGLRCPDHPLTQELLAIAGIPLAAPSANPSGEPSPKNADTVFSYFGGKIDAVIDGGECGIGTESTLLSMAAMPYRVLREGALKREEIAQALLQRMTVIGITGMSGSGKTTALSFFAEEGAGVIDCDALYHELLEENVEMRAELSAVFPAAVTSEGIDRRALAAIVFSDEEKLKELNRITHRYVKAAVQERLLRFAMEGKELAAVDAVELISGELAELCSVTVGVIAPRELRCERIMARDGISRERALQRIEAQKDESYYRSQCEHILENSGDSAAFYSALKNIYREITTHE